MIWRAHTLCLLMAAGACAQSQSPAPRERRALAGTAVAEVGSHSIDKSTVERIAQAQRLEPRAALENAVADAVFAAEASERIPVSTSRVITRAALARALLEEFSRAARAAGPATDAEIDKLSAERWVELDRPEAVRVAHAVALRPKGGEAVPARKEAEAIREETASARTPEDFVKIVKSRAKSAIEVRVERLPYITADGRGFSGEGPFSPTNRFEESFARAANALEQPGDFSPIVETSYGYHIIYLEARLPARRVALEDRRRALQAEVLSRRAATQKADLITSLGKATRVEVQRDADELTAQLLQ